MGWLDAFGPIAWLDAFCPIGFQAIPIWLSLGRHPISRQTIQISVKINKKQFKDLPSFFILRQTIQISVKNEIKNNSNIYLAANNSIICRPFFYLAANNSNICRLFLFGGKRFKYLPSVHSQSATCCSSAAIKSCWNCNYDKSYVNNQYLKK